VTEVALARRLTLFLLMCRLYGDYTVLCFNRFYFRLLHTNWSKSTGSSTKAHYLTTKM